MKWDFAIFLGFRDVHEELANLFIPFLERYLELLKESKIKGYLFEQQNYVPKE